MRDVFKRVEVGVVSVDGVEGRRSVYCCRLWSVVGNCYVHVAFACQGVCGSPLPLCGCGRCVVRVASVGWCPVVCGMRSHLFVFLREDPCSELMALGHVMTMGSARRLRQLAKRSAYVIAGVDRGQLGFCCGTGRYERSSEKFLFQGNSVA